LAALVADNLQAGGVLTTPTLIDIEKLVETKINTPHPKMGHAAWSAQSRLSYGKFPSYRRFPWHESARSDTAGKENVKKSQHDVTDRL
jgi:hypothetical protein